MVEIWFGLVCLLLTAYAVLDGFDLGAGILHLFLAKSHDDRARVLATIGPFWDGNEVCLIAAGGTLFLAFPALLGSALSGFYLAIFMLLWSLLLRGLSIELRNHVSDPLWKSFWDTVFAFSSTLLAFLLGTALANVVRGVPLDADGYFSLPLFTSSLPYGEVGLLDVYTASAGLTTTVLLAAHGSMYLAWKATPALAERARSFARRLYLLALPLLLACTAFTFHLRPDMLQALLQRPLGWLALLLLLGSLAGVLASLRSASSASHAPHDRRGFLASCALLVSVFAATAVGTFPTVLHGTLAERMSMSAYDAASPRASLVAGLWWWPVAALLAVGYFSLLFRLHRGRLGDDS